MSIWVIRELATKERAHERPNKDTPERAEVNKIASEGMQQGVKDVSIYTDMT